MGDDVVCDDDGQWMGWAVKEEVAAAASQQNDMEWPINFTGNYFSNEIVLLLLLLASHLKPIQGRGWRGLKRWSKKTN